MNNVFFLDGNMADMEEQVLFYFITLAGKLYAPDTTCIVLYKVKGAG